MNLNLETFKALGSKTRLDIIRMLKDGRMTLSEVSSALNMHVSTVKEHLDVLESAGLIQMEDEGYKWKYYNLTRTGKDILAPYPTEIKIILPVAIGLVLVGSAKFFKYARKVEELSVRPMAQEAMMKAAPEVSAEAPTPMIPSPPIWTIVLIILGVFLLGLTVGLQIRRNDFRVKTRRKE